MAKQWKLYKTSVYFIIIYVGLFICICLYRFIEGSDESFTRVEKSSGEWILCIFQHFKHPGDDPVESGECDRYPKYRPNVAAMAVMMTMIICLGFGMFLIYGWRKEHWKMWKNVLEAKGIINQQSSVRNVSNVNGTIMSSRVGDDGVKKKKKGGRGFFQNSVAVSSGMLSGGGSSRQSSSVSSGVEDQGTEKPDDYLPDKQTLKELQKKEREILKLDVKYGVAGHSQHVEKVREDLISYSIYILPAKDWPLKVPKHISDRAGSENDLRDVLALMTHVSSIPELQGWACSKYTYDPEDGSEDHLKPIISVQDQRQALLGIRYHWTSGEFVWIKRVSASEVRCHKMTDADFATVAHTFDPTPVLKACEHTSLEDAHAAFLASCPVDTSCPYW
jgi:hypothetical protein